MSDLAARIITIRKKYTERNGPVIADAEEIANIATALARHMLTSKSFSMERYTDGMKQLEKLAAVLMRQDPNAVVIAVADIPPDSARAIEELLLKTDWGRLQCGQLNATNLDIWIKAWDIVLDSMGERGRSPQTK